MLKIFCIFITSLIFLSSAHAETVKVFEFTEKELSALEIRKVRGADNKTSYTVGSNENGNFLKAVADNAASGLGKEIKIDLNKIEQRKSELISIDDDWRKNTTDAVAAQLRDAGNKV